MRVLDCSAPARPQLEGLLSPEALARLESFAEAVNKAALHEPDLGRWAAFIEQAHLEEAVIDHQQLETWLADEGFPKDQRARLIGEYESGRRLLRAYDEGRR